VVSERTGDLGGVAAYALDPDNADRLWERSLALLSAAGSPLAPR
jgi:hypothetical protein